VRATPTLPSSARSPFVIPSYGQAADEIAALRNAANQAADAAFAAARNAANQAASAAGNAEDEIVEVIKGWRTGGGGGRRADDTDPHLAPNLARHPIPARHVIASNARSPSDFRVMRRI